MLFCLICYSIFKLLSAFNRLLIIGINKLLSTPLEIERERKYTTTLEIYFSIIYYLERETVDEAFAISNGVKQN